MSLPRGINRDDITNPDFEFIFREGDKERSTEANQEVILVDHRGKQCRVVFFSFRWEFANQIPNFLNAVMERLLLTLSSPAWKSPTDKRPLLILDDPVSDFRIPEEARRELADWFKQFPDIRRKR